MLYRFTLAFMLISAIAFSQGQFKGGLEFGIMGTQVDGDTLSGYDKAGARIGGYIERPVTKEWAVQFGIIYTQKGSKGARKEEDWSSFYQINLHYFDIPFTGRYYHKSGFFGEGGIAIGYLFKAKEQGYNIYREFIVDKNPEFNKLEFSWHLGIGYKIFPRTYIHTQFSYSLLKIRGKYESQVPGVYAGQFNNTLMVALQIYLGKVD